MLPFAELMTACDNDSASTESAKRLVLTWINYSCAEALPDDGEEYKIGRFYQVDDDYKPKRGEKVYRDR